MIRTHSLLSPRLALSALAAAVLVGLVLAAVLSTNGGARADGHATGAETIVVTPNEANFVPGTRSSSTKVWIYGSGFTPGQSVLVLTADQRGVATDIGALAGVDVAANDDGAFGFEWTFGRFTRTGVGAEGMQSVRAVDAGSFDELATAPLALCYLTRVDDAESALAAAEMAAAEKPGDPAAAQAVDDASADLEAVKAAPVPSHCSS